MNIKNYQGNVQDENNNTSSIGDQSMFTNTFTCPTQINVN